MKKNDYGSIAYNDLRILIRIGKERKKTHSQQTTIKQYRGSWLDLWFGSRNELKFLTLGFLGSSWIMGSFILGLMMHPDDRPRDFIDLRNEYTLPFIHPKHLLNIPESLQSNYDRLVPIRSAMNFVKGFTNTLLGFDVLPSQSRPNNSIFSSSKHYYANLYQNQKIELEEIESKRKSLEKNLLSDHRNALVALPAIAGESFQGSLLRLEDKLQIWHKNNSVTLSSRRKVTAEFTADKQYDFTEYRSSGSQDKVNFFKSEFTDEEIMYQEVKKLADYAEENQQQIIKFRQSVVPITTSNSAPIAVAIDSNFLSLLWPKDFRQFNAKINGITASTFNPDKPKIIREPLIGTIDPRLIEQTIGRYRFELQLCYELSLRRNQQSAGTMEWQWHLDTQGQVYDIELVKSTISDTKMISCVRDKIANWKWPKSQKGSIQISYPFLFKPSKG